MVDIAVAYQQVNECHLSMETLQANVWSLSPSLTGQQVPYFAALELYSLSQPVNYPIENTCLQSPRPSVHLALMGGKGELF